MKLEVIKQDAIVEIKISATFYSRIFQLSNNLVVDKTKQQMENLLNKLQAKQELEQWESDYETLLILMAEIQKKCKETNQIEIIDNID